MIRMMCNEDMEGAYCDLRWTKDVGHPIILRETHQGLVLGLREMNGYDDSDFYAIVWNADKGDVEEICYASTRGWTYPCGAAVDATPDVQAAYDSLVAARQARARVERAAYEAAIPQVGRTVQVIDGRKLPKGTVAEVGWYGRDRFARPYAGPRASDFGIYGRDAIDAKRGFRVGLKIAGQKDLVFINALHVTVTAAATD